MKLALFLFGAMSFQSGMFLGLSATPPTHFVMMALTGFVALLQLFIVWTHWETQKDNNKHKT